LYYKWRDIFLEHADEIFGGQRGIQKKDNKDRIAELEVMVGRLAMENENFKKAKS